VIRRQPPDEPASVVSKKRILVVEDDAAIAAALRDNLDQLGFDLCCVASTADSAIALAGERRPDLVLMDINLEGEKDGIHAAEHIRSSYHIPVVFMSGDTDPRTTGRATRTLPFGYLMKPYTIDALRVTIELALYRQEVEAKSHRLEHWLSTAFTSLGDAVVVIDPNRRITLFNAAAERLTGWSRQEAIGCHYHDVLWFVSSSGKSDGKDPVAEAFVSGLTVNYNDDIALLTRTGTVVPIDDNAAPLRSGDSDRIDGIVLAIRNRSNERRADEERRQIERRMQEAQHLESLGLLAGSIAHDFNNLLGSILGNAELTRHELPPGNPGRRYLDHVEQATTRAADLCRQMLAYAGEGAYDVRSLDVNEVVRTTVGQLEQSKHGVPLGHLELPAAVPPVLLDPTQLQQLIANLVANAREAVRDGDPAAITIKTGHVPAMTDAPDEIVLAPESTPESLVLLEVSDQGGGIASETLPRIWDPFFTTKFAGRGLGLSAVHGIVRSAKGGIALRSEFGKGTRVRVYFPATAGR
jgi:PAS domain S-box-containing protein